MMPVMKKVAVALSGGVDSAVSAFLLKQKGFRVVGVYMKNWDERDELGECSLSQDAEDAEFASRTIGIPFKEVSFIKEYWNEVFTYFLESYRNGRNPNPDIMCNRKIKFDAFHRYAFESLGVDAVATGHYARTSFGCYHERYRPDEKVALIKAVDHQKDQTFFLSQVPQEALRRTMFPVGALTKNTVKQIALENGLGRLAKKRESMGLCFIGRRNFRNFINNYIVPDPGEVINISTGRVESRHSGIHFWILGQRFPMAGLGKQRYVVHKGFGRQLLVGTGPNHPALLCNMVFTSKPHWIRESPKLDLSFDCMFQFQHIDRPIKCRIFSLKSGDLLIILRTPLTQLNPGQFAVFYKGNECLGSAEIVKTGPSYFSLGKAVPEDFQSFDDEREALEMLS